MLTADGGQEALELFTGQPDAIDLVILDLVMPRMSGADLFERLRTFNPRVRILLSSGYSLNGEAKDIMAKGCNGFLQKPFQLSTLSRKVREVLS